MPVIFRIVSPVVRPLAQAQRSVDVFGRGQVSVVPHDGHVGTDEVLAEGRRLAHESRNHAFVALRQHRGHDVPFGREIEEREEVVDGLDASVVFGPIDVRKLVHHWVHFQPVTLEGQALLEVQLGLCGGVGRVPVKHGPTNVHPLSRKGDVVAVGARTHRKQETATQDKIADRSGHFTLHLTHFLEAHELGGGALAFYLRLVPRRAAVGLVELPVLSCEILVVQVQPIVLGQLARQDLLVVNHVVRDFSVGQHQGHRVVPRLLAVRAVHRHLGRHLQLHAFHIHLRIRHFLQNLRRLHVSDDLMGDPTNDALILNFRDVGHQKTAPSVVQQPLHFDPILQNPKRHAVRLQVVGLTVVHGHQNPGAPSHTHQGQSHQTQQSSAHPVHVVEGTSH